MLFIFGGNYTIINITEKIRNNPMGKRLKSLMTWLAVAVSAVLLTTLGIDAVDNMNNFSNSIIGSLFVDRSEQTPCPPDMAYIQSPDGGYCIDKFENAPGDGCPVKNLQSQVDTAANLGYGECQPVSKEGVYPWVFVSQDQARELCARAGKRLPTANEWSLAALGTPDKTAGWDANDCQVALNWSEHPGSAGSGKNCVSSAGAFDMVGNVWEWIEGVAADGLLDGMELPESGYVVSSDGKGLVLATDPENPDANYYGDFFWIRKQGVRGIAKGGYYENESKAGVYSAYLISAPSFAGVGVGFRCVK